MDPLSGFALVLTLPVNVPTSRNALARVILAHLERDEGLVQGEIFPRFLANLGEEPAESCRLPLRMTSIS